MNVITFDLSAEIPNVPGIRVSSFIREARVKPVNYDRRYIFVLFAVFSSGVLEMGRLTEPN